MNRITKLTELFSRFPGIGPRQSKRFVHFLLHQPKSFHNELATLLQGLQEGVNKCVECHRFFGTNGERTDSCNICDDKNRNTSTIMIVEKDVDLDNIERSGIYDGHYFVLGGTVPVLESEPEKRVHSNELSKKISNGSYSEIILALSATPDGDNTGDYIKRFLEDIVKDKNISLSKLGRGLSTGSELEYSDTETIKNAFNNRG